MLAHLRCLAIVRARCSLVQPATFSAAAASFSSSAGAPTAGSRAAASPAEAASAAAAAASSDAVADLRGVPARAARRLSNMFYDESVQLSRRQQTVFSRLDDAPPLPPAADHGYLHGFSADDLASSSDAVRRALSTRTGAQSDLRSFRTADTVRRFGATPRDTGATRVQVALLTSRITLHSAHLARNKHDTTSKRALQILVSRRRRLLQYMVRTDYANYRVVVKELGLRPIPVIGSRHTPKVRAETHKKINERNHRLKNRSSRGALGH